MLLDILVVRIYSPTSNLLSPDIQEMAAKSNKSGPVNPKSTAGLGSCSRTMGSSVYSRQFDEGIVFLERKCHGGDRSLSGAKNIPIMN